MISLGRSVAVMMKHRNRPYELADGPLSRQPRNPRSRVTIPERVGPEVKLFFGTMREQGRVMQDVATASGVRLAAFKAWRHRNQPSWISLSAALSSLGFQFTAVPALEILPPELAGDLAALAAKMRRGLPETWAALVAIDADQRYVRDRAAERFAEIDKRRAEVEAVRTEKKGRQREEQARRLNDTGRLDRTR